MVYHRLSAKFAQDEISVGDDLPGVREGLRRQLAQEQRLSQRVHGVCPHAGAVEKLKVPELLRARFGLGRGTVIHAQNGGVQSAKLRIHWDDGVALDGDTQRTQL